MSYLDYNFKIRYTKNQDNIADEFYLPCMREAKRYDRISGYFRSTIFILAWNALKDFVKNGGKMRLICSPFVPASDQAAAELGYEARNSEKIRQTLIEEIEDVFANKYLAEPAKVLAYLIAIGVIDIRIAIGLDKSSPNLIKLFHEKAGVFIDKDNHCVAFEGSMNETYSGLSSDGNIEAIAVYLNWQGERDALRTEGIQHDFEQLWQNKAPMLKVYQFPDEAKEILKKYSANCDWEKIVDKVIEKDVLANKWKPNETKRGRKPRPHQVAVLESWKNNGCKGILEHATGSGKTYTSLCAIKYALGLHKIPLILVPSKELLFQWKKELNDTFPDLRILLCGDGNHTWKTKSLLRTYSTPSSNRNKAIVAIMDTAATPAFLNNIEDGSHIFLVADELHRLGSQKRRNIFQINSGASLGLSATPCRYGDLEGTSAILKYFDKILEPKFSLQDAIKAEVLTPYFYYPHCIHLNAEEQENWDSISFKISRQIAILSSHKSGGPDISLFENPSIKSLIIQRARILKNAEEKVDVAINVVKENFKHGQKWIIYCDNQKQLKKVLEQINSKCQDVLAYEYHSEMHGDRARTLAHFQNHGGILVSIKCLDEGVDIPSTTHALILASSKNPREFIQRRGRILRRADAFGKQHAFLHDAIVIPHAPELDNIRQAAILESELSRAICFGEWAINSAFCITTLKLLAIQYGIDVKTMANGGTENDDSDE